MNQDDMGRLSVGIILGVVGAVVITKAGITPRDAILRWLIFALVTGILLNTQEGRKLSYLLIAAVLSALSLVLAILFLGLLGQGVIPSLSGIKVDFANNPIFAVTFLSIVGIGSTIAVLVAAFSRPITLGLLQNFNSIDLVKAKNIESLLKLTISIAGLAALLIFSII